VSSAHPAAHHEDKSGRAQLTQGLVRKLPCEVLAENSLTARTLRFPSSGLRPR
jgi:hypothetical protein